MRRTKRLLKRMETSSNTSGTISATSIEMTLEIALPFSIHGKKNYSSLSYRGISPEESEALGGIGIEMTVGVSGAEWE